MLHSAQVNPTDWEGGERLAPSAQTTAPNAELRAPDVNRGGALATLNEAMRKLAATQENTELVRQLDEAYAYFHEATAEWEIRAADMWNAALRAADAEIRAVALPRAGWSPDAQSSACTCALIVRSLTIGSARPPLTPEEQAQQAVLRG